jgi:transcriptional regulator with XRE-family HTH domain
MPLDIANIFGDNVKRIRESKNWSQEKLSEKADLHRTYISQIESGKRNPTLLIVQQLAEALGVKPSKLLEEEGKH